MLISQIFWMLKQYLVFALLGVDFLAILFYISYFIVYRKLLKGQKKINLKSACIVAAFVCYLLMVLYATLFSRESMGYCSVNLDLFSSYLEAWNSFTLRRWQLLILNIIMFVPFGMLLPLMNKRFKRVIWSASAGALFTILIETVQLIFNLGVFEVDDIVNNFAGAMIGYGFTMATLSVLHREKNLLKKITCYLLPLFLVIGGFAGIFIKYNMNELGNLEEAYSTKIKCEDARITSDIKLSKESKQDVIYRTKVYDKKTALEYAKKIFKGMGIAADDLKILQFNDNALYTSHKESEYSLWIEYAGGMYSYTDYTFDKFKPASKPVEEKTIISALKKMNVTVPAGLTFEKEEQEGQFCFKADMIKDKDKYLLGELSGTLYQDGVIRNLDNSLAALEKYKDVDVMSEAEAFEKIKQGKFNIYLEEELSSIKVQSVKLEYRADSKGFYQPVYNFKVKINDEQNFIPVPAID
ncbi:MAG: VanZ family protein [Aminipila sp.]